MSATHTPTPWYCDNAAGTTIWNAAGHGLIAECPEPAEWLGAKKLDRAANAAFIVRACNAHDGLVAIAEELSIALGALMIDKEHGECEAMHPDVADGLAQAAIKRYAEFRAALAKAGA